MYAYVGGDPLRYSDPNGECPWCLAGAIIGGGLNLGVQLYQNGGNLGEVNWLHVGVATATGALGGGAGSWLFAKTTNLAINIIGNAAVGSALGAGSTAYQNYVGNECERVSRSAVVGGVLGAAGGYFGAGIGNDAAASALAAQAAVNRFLNTLLPNGRAFTGDLVGRSVAGAGGAIGNAVGNVISNSGPAFNGP
jgi:hypothetical protein